ncbi:MAG: two-component system LytT family sensor kinase [Rhodothermales bacterium]|jgi:two-component system LytT family sensor kinase
MPDTLRLPVPPAAWSIGRRWTFIFALWTVPGLAALSFYYLNQVVTGQAVVWSFALASTLPNWYFWALLTPAVMAAAHRYPLEQDNWLRNVLLVHVPAMVLMILLHSLANLLLFRGVGLHDTLNVGLYKVHITSRIHANVLAYWTVLGVYQAITGFRKLRSRDAEAAAMEIELAQAHLRALKMQLNPHFLFNTLNSITALIRKSENPKAVKMTVKLSAFLRLALENRGMYEVGLREEVDFARKYLDIEQVRFGDNLKVDVNLEPGTEDLYVPNMILQPIVENAIHHGVAQRGEPGLISVTSCLDGDRLILSVRDNGPGPGNSKGKGTGVGISTTRKRLERLYGDAYEMELRSAADGGAEVIVVLPAVKQPIFEPSSDQLI